MAQSLVATIIKHFHVSFPGIVSLSCGRKTSLAYFNALCYNLRKQGILPSHSTWLLIWNFPSFFLYFGISDQVFSPHQLTTSLLASHIGTLIKTVSACEVQCSFLTHHHHHLPLPLSLFTKEKLLLPLGELVPYTVAGS